MNYPEVVIPAAGEGTRLKDIAFLKAKPIVPVCGKPVIAWILEILMKQGFTNISTVVPNESNQDPTAIFIQDIYSNLLKLRFLRQKNQLGPLHAIKLALPSIKTNGVLVFLADTICFKELSNFGFDSSWVLLARVEDYEPWCMVQLENGIVKKFYDKPSSRVTTDLAIIGIYYFHDKEYFQKCAEDVIKSRKKLNREYQISSAIELYMKKYDVKAHITESWYDCGSVENLRKTSDSLITKKTRAFNQLNLSTKTGTIQKKSAGEFGSKTLSDEINFYLSIPKEHQIYFPRILDSENRPDNSKILFEYWPLNNLADTFLYFRYSEYLWQGLIKNLVSILKIFRLEASYDTIEKDTYDILWNKTTKRIQELKEQNFHLADKKEFLLNNKEMLGWPLLKENVHKRILNISKNPISAVLHGDMCFSNILSDISSGIIKFVDPRGMFGKTAGTLGDQRYDIAKLRQSYHGFYDFIVNNLYEIEKITENSYYLKIYMHRYHNKIKELFDYEIFRSTQISVNEIEIIEGLLFISMCPLHYEDKIRQKAFWLKGLEVLNGCALIRNGDNNEQQ